MRSNVCSANKAAAGVSHDIDGDHDHDHDVDHNDNAKIKKSINSPQNEYGVESTAVWTDPTRK